MKIGFSLGRCVRDLVNGDIQYDDVLFIISATAIHDELQLDNVILNYLYEPTYLAGLDQKACMEMARRIFNGRKLLQPRLQGISRHAAPEDALWVDLFPTFLSDKPSVQSAWDAYRFMLHMTEVVPEDHVS
jgi:hypothetical protein